MGAVYKWKLRKGLEFFCFCLKLCSCVWIFIWIYEKRHNFFWRLRSYLRNIICHVCVVENWNWNLDAVLVVLAFGGLQRSSPKGAKAFEYLACQRAEAREGGESTVHHSGGKLCIARMEGFISSKNTLIEPLILQQSLFSEVEECAEVRSWSRREYFVTQARVKDLQLLIRTGFVKR